MPDTPEGLDQRLSALLTDLVAQGRRVEDLIEQSLDAVFQRDAELATRVVDLDDTVDRVDVEIERSAVAILFDATRENVHLDQTQGRRLLNGVKINNELERIADIGVAMAERVKRLETPDQPIPPTLRVMANSVVGILRDAIGALERGDATLAKLVLRGEAAIETFKTEIMRDAERQVLGGQMSIAFAFFLNGIAAQLVMMADHCSNVAEQVIYAETGAIVRHGETGWVEKSLGNGG